MMSETIELRCPFLSRSIVEMALGLPRPQRTSKQFLKAAFGHIVPKAILDRPKRTLKVNEIRNDEDAFRTKQISDFREVFFDERN